MNREQFQQKLRVLAAQRAREIIANKDEIIQTGATAQRLFNELRNAETWQLAATPKPEGLGNPVELWSQPVTITRPTNDR